MKQYGHTRQAGESTQARGWVQSQCVAQGRQSPTGNRSGRTTTMAQGTGIAAAMKFFGKERGQVRQTLSEFRDEWQGLDETSQAQLVTGITSGTLTY